MTLIAGMLFVSDEGALLGIGFVIRNMIQTLFVPMGRKNHEVYSKYRERKLAERKKRTDHCILVTGLVFLSVGILFTIIWYIGFYSKVA